MRFLAELLGAVFPEYQYTWLFPEFEESIGLELGKITGGGRDTMRCDAMQRGGGCLASAHASFFAAFLFSGRFLSCFFVRLFCFREIVQFFGFFSAFLPCLNFLFRPDGGRQTLCRKGPTPRGWRGCSDATRTSSCRRSTGISPADGCVDVSLALSLVIRSCHQPGPLLSLLNQPEWFNSMTLAALPQPLILASHCAGCSSVYSFFVCFALRFSSSTNQPPLARLCVAPPGMSGRPSRGLTVFLGCFLKKFAKFAPQNQPPIHARGNDVQTRILPACLPCTSRC